MTIDCESYGTFVTLKYGTFVSLKDYKFLEEMTKRHEALEEELAIAQKKVEIATAQGKLAMVTFKPDMNGEMHPVAAIMEVKPKKATKDTLFMFWLSIFMLAMTTVGFVALF